jgi:hypothetical protein
VSGEVQTAWVHLGIENDEAVVLSAVYETTADTPILMAASLLAGPATIANGWPTWRHIEGFKPRPSDDALQLPGEFLTALDGAVAGRATLRPEEAYRWLRSALETGICPAVGELPEAHASLGAARAPIRICTHSETKAGDLATWLARPIVGFHFPRTDEAAGVLAGNSWTIEDVQLFFPAIDALGISWFEEKNGSPPSGLLLGRFERRAWLVSQRLEPEDDLYKVEIGLESDRVELMDLEIEVEEQVGDELVFAERLRLEDTDLSGVEDALYGPPPTEGRLELGVALPTLGRGMKRSVRLTHRDGMLLDEWQSFNIVESISINLAVKGAEQKPIAIGETRGPQDLVGLLGAVQRVRRQYADLRRGGAHNRVFEEVAKGMKALRALLERASGELLVVDAFFKDWSLLLGLEGPPARVLIGQGAELPPAAFGGKVGRWTKDLAPFHDRFFLWEGGGVSVGTSAGSIHDRLFRIVRIGASESEVLRERFTLWWDDPGFERL